jgi:hypothetical protein
VRIILKCILEHSVWNTGWIQVFQDKFKWLIFLTHWINFGFYKRTEFFDQLSDYRRFKE